jgi:hypothetical protein
MTAKLIKCKVVVFDKLYIIFDIHRTVRRDIYSYNKNQHDALFLEFILVKNSKYFEQIYCPSSGVSTLYTQQ